MDSEVAIASDVTVHATPALGRRYAIERGLGQGGMATVRRNL